MDLLVAQDIAHIWCSGQKIQAIKTLRGETALGLIDAKNYLETGAASGEEALVKKLCEDYVQNKEDLLIQARQEMKRLKLYIEQLESEIFADARVIDLDDHVVTPFLSTIVYTDLPTGDFRESHGKLFPIAAHPTEPWHGAYTLVDGIKSELPQGVGYAQDPLFDMPPQYCTQCLEHKHDGQCERYWAEDTESWYNYADEYVEVVVVGLMFELPHPEETEENS